MKLKLPKVKVPKALMPMAIKMNKKKPEILLGAGLVTGAVGVVVACKETVSAMDILEEHKTTMAAIDECREKVESGEIDAETYSEDMYKHDIVVAYSKTGTNLVKNYAPAASLLAISTACVLSSYNIMKKRNIALTVAYTGLHEAFNKYRQRVIEDQGIEKDREYRFGTHKETTIVEKKGRGGKVKEIEVEEDVLNKPEGGTSEYARFFDEACPQWDKAPGYNASFVKGVERFCNQKLMIDGFMFLNDVYDQLGFEKTVAGQMVGWLYDDEHQGFIDFGLDTPAGRDFLAGDERSALLDFNVDGVIIDKAGFREV